ncbi:tripeptidyl-peptidase, partial [Thraustotheca clavata]
MEIPEHIKSKITFTTLDSAPIHVNAKGRPIDIPLSNLESAEAGKPPLATPDKIKQLYNVPGNITAKLATQSIAAFYTESWSPVDLTLFQSQFNLTASPITQKGDRYNNVSNPTGEASLDIQYITALAPGSPTTVWTMNGSNPFSSGDEPFVSWAEHVLADPAPSLVHSISYGDEEDHIMEVSKDYAFHLDTLLQKMGARGLTVLVASGDNGVSGTRITDGGMNVTEGCSKSAPEWPASSPWVTTIGATQLADDGVTEIVCSGATNGLITSGGGFSSVYSTPDYQKDAVLSYLASSNAPHKDGFFNTHGRGYPDISAIGANFPVAIS